jgi:hypothetical protein
MHFAVNDVLPRKYLNCHFHMKGQSNNIEIVDYECPTGNKGKEISFKEEWRLLGCYTMWLL